MSRVETNSSEPLIPANVKLPELTLKVILLSILLAAVMSAANAYLALKIGQTISASIPASVLAIGILRFFKNSNVLESNLIQTAASAGEGVAAAISFVLPAMILIHAWKGFGYWQTFAITVFGGLMGVFFSIPLRRVMLSMKTLTFPEGTAVGNVLRVTSDNAGSGFMKRLIQGTGIGGLMAFAQSGIQIFSDSVGYWFRAGSGVFGIGMGFSPAIFAAGYIIGLEVGISFFIGFVLGWVVVLPGLAMHYGLPSAKSTYDSVMTLWTTHLRFVGVGVMLVGGVWTLLRLIKPVLAGIKVSIVTLRQVGDQRDGIPRTERDIPIVWAFVGVIVSALLLYFMVMHFAMVEGLYNEYPHSFLLFVGFVTIVYVLIVGFFLATICAYFTGLVGSSNNPLSGILILAVLLLGLVYMFLFHDHNGGKIAALMVIVTTVVATCASISNENLQDLKAGQMVGSTPWKQQIVLALGVIVSAFVIGPVLDLLFQAYGMGGVFPHAGMNPSQMLAAPQAGLMSSVINGVRSQNLPWHMIFLGAGLAVLIIIVDEILRRNNRRLPALAVGLSIYLPPSIILPTVVGGVVRYFVDKSAKSLKSKKELERAADLKQNGVLVACGLVAGAALMGVILAIPFVIMGSSDALAIMPAHMGWLKDFLGFASFAGMAYWTYSISRYRKN